MENDPYKKIENLFIMPDDEKENASRKKALGQKDAVNKNKKVSDKEKK
ncbi:hypothetical protein [Oenococcus sicerae]